MDFLHLELQTKSSRNFVEQSLWNTLYQIPSYGDKISDFV